MADARLPAHLEVSALIRAVEAAGGFGTIVARGERDAGTILILTTERGGNARLWERMPRVDGARIFELVRQQDPENPHKFSEYCDRRKKQDSDLWIVELDVPNAERFIEGTGTVN